MGNDQSILKGLKIDQKAIEVTDFWSIYSGEIPKENTSPTLISIFKSEPIISGQLWKTKSPLERATKSLMIYRHPSILRFIASWNKGSSQYLATERCKPLSLALASQNDIQICIGLRNILCGLIFLVEKANMCHLNICTSSIYISIDNTWRLNGFEHLWPKKDVTNNFLDLSQSHRYKNALDKDESKRGNTFGIEQFSFGVLCEEILGNHLSTGKLPNVIEFRNYCKEHLRNTKATMRPMLSAILLHPYFNQDFVLIHSFLTELPLKSIQEKQSFFTGLIERLRSFDETIVAAELIDLILSRMVVLDETAKLYVIPFILRPRTEVDSLVEPTPLFSVETFQKFVSPKIGKLFLVREVSIRLILLEYFSEYMHYFESKIVLIENILPQLLLGIKDTNDILVAATLRCLADLVPILGSSVVIGHNRGKLFADGRPTGSLDIPIVDVATVPRWTEARSITPVLNGVEVNFLSASPLPDAVDLSDSFISASASQHLNQNQMPIRLSPDGGEDVQTASEQPDFEADDEDWSDWESDNQQQQQQHQSNISENGLSENTSIAAVTQPTPNTRLTNVNNIIKDIKDIEIKATKIHDEIDDFFKEMEPVIAKTNISLDILLHERTSANSINNINTENFTETKQQHNDTDIRIDQNRFAIKTENTNELVDDNAWGNETNDWDVDS